MDKVIHMENVSWRREGTAILQDVNWQVKAGEHWAVLGLNGAGKTSMLNMVNGYIWPTLGKVTVLDNEFGKTDIHELRKSIGWVSSSLGQRINGRHPAEDIVVSGKYAAVGLVYADATPEDEAEALKWMEQLGVAHTYGQAYEKCSQGEKQKLLIARGLMAHPRLLILDEPTNGLDFIAREELLATIEQLGKTTKELTIIFVTHHIEEVLPTFSHVLLLENGSVFSQGSREDVLTSERLSALYKQKIDVAWRNNRAWMTLA